jgi:hypothetical protein
VFPGIGSASEDDELDDLLAADQAELERLAREAREAALRRDATEPDGAPVGLMVGLTAPLGVGLLVFAFWSWSLRGMDPATRSYTRMSRAGRLFGLPRARYQTASEFAAAIGRVAPSAAEPAGAIAREYEGSVYGRRTITAEQSKGLDRAWRRVLRGIVAFRLRQLWRLGPEFGERRST